MGDVTYGPESRGSPRGQRNCRILSSVTHKHPLSFSSRHIKVGLLHFHLALTSIGIGTKVKIEIVEKSATEMQVHPKLSCISLGRGLRCWQSDSGKNNTAPFWSPACEKGVQLLIDWIGPVVILPRVGISSIHTCDRCRKMRGLIKNFIQIFCRHPVESL